MNHSLQNPSPVESTPLTFSGIPLWKRALDISLVLITFPLWLPIGLAVALAIKFISPGPVFFKQQRIGYLRRRFFCLKFRTMVPNADAATHQGHLVDLMNSNGPLTKLDAAGDPRLIPGGTWVRSLGLDELPQLINVLRGEMSIVGPRPCIPYECNLYEPHHFNRFEALPGLTGLWQVSGKNRTTFEEMMELDLKYVRRKSLPLDLTIIAKTIPAIVVQFRDDRKRKRVARQTRHSGPRNR